MAQPLILLFGMPRSGTTWLGKIFDSHPATLYRHEPDSQGTLNALIPLFAHARDAENYRTTLESYVTRITHMRDEKVSSSLPIFPKQYYGPVRLTLRKLLVPSIKAAAHMLGPLPVPNLVNLKHHPNINVVWKSIESLGRLGVLARVFPEARCVLILRHPCGYIASVLRGEAARAFQGKTRASEDWEIFNLLLQLPSSAPYGLDLAAVVAMTPIERLALKWALYYEHAITDTAGISNVTSVRYEDFCQQPQHETEKIFQICGLPWADGVSQFIARSTSRERGAYYSVFKSPTVAAWKWRNELSADDIERILRVTSRFRAGAFYSRECL